jgi:nitrate reductase delta subunit
MIRTRRASAIPFKLLSVLLRYPDRRLVEAREELAAIVDALPRSPQREPLQRFVAHLAGRTQTELERQYVETFDLRRRSGLYLSYYVHGDTRKRGMALLRLKRLYAAAGLELTSGELPDYLPLMLEFAALAPAGAGETLLSEYRPSLELLRAGLHDDGNPYADVLDALCESLPRLSALEREHVRLLGKQGPPEEQVGLQPFAPPEVMPSEARI